MCARLQARYNDDDNDNNTVFEGETALSTARLGRFWAVLGGESEIQIGRVIEQLNSRKLSGKKWITEREISP